MQSEILLRTGISIFAALAGLACYYGAQAIGVNQTIAAAAGLVFALLVWISARSLFRDLLAEIRRGRTENHDQTDR